MERPRFTKAVEIGTAAGVALTATVTGVNPSIEGARAVQVIERNVSSYFEGGIPSQNTGLVVKSNIAEAAGVNCKAVLNLSSDPDKVDVTESLPSNPNVVLIKGRNVSPKGGEFWLNGYSNAIVNSREAMAVTVASETHLKEMRLIIPCGLGWRGAFENNEPLPTHSAVPSTGSKEVSKPISQPVTVVSRPYVAVRPSETLWDRLLKDAEIILDTPSKVADLALAAPTLLQGPNLGPVPEDTRPILDFFGDIAILVVGSRLIFGGGRGHH